MIHPVIAIDGPAASGKGTVAKELAERLEFVHVDTGAMYRAFAWLTCRKKMVPATREDIKKLIQETKFDTEIKNGKIILRMDGIEVEPYIREAHINQTVSHIAKLPELREYLVNRQRQLRLQAPLVMEGRDIGTVVATDTPYKFFLDADPEIRAERRRAQGTKDTLIERDKIDSTRAQSPLVRAADAEYVDSSRMTISEVIEHIYQRVLDKGLKKISGPVSPV